MKGEEFQMLVARLGISHAEFASLIGKTATTISRYSQGSQSVPRAVCMLLRLDVGIDAIRAASKACCKKKTPASKRADRQAEAPE